MPIRVLIVDDNELDRLNLRLMLSRVTDIELAGEAGDVPSARALLEKTPADALFLDIRLKDQKAFALKDSLGKIPFVIFTTLYEKYALQAFNVAAFDYLLKPVTMQRLAQTLERLRVRMDEKCRTAPDATVSSCYILVDSGTQNVMLKGEDIAAILADGDYTRVIDRYGREFLTRRRMKEWLNLLQNSLVALDRSLLVNLNCIESLVRPMGNSQGSLHIRNYSKSVEIGDIARRRLLEICKNGDYSNATGG